METQAAYSEMTDSQLRRTFADGMNGNGGGWQSAWAATLELQRRSTPIPNMVDMLGNGRAYP